MRGRSVGFPRQGRYSRQGSLVSRRLSARPARRHPPASARRTATSVKASTCSRVLFVRSSPLSITACGARVPLSGAVAELGIGTCDHCERRRRQHDSRSTQARGDDFRLAKRSKGSRRASQKRGTMDRREADGRNVPCSRHRAGSPSFRSGGTAADAFVATNARSGRRSSRGHVDRWSHRRASTKPKTKATYVHGGVRPIRSIPRDDGKRRTPRLADGARSRCSCRICRIARRFRERDRCCAHRACRKARHGWVPQPDRLYAGSIANHREAREVGITGRTPSSMTANRSRKETVKLRARRHLRRYGRTRLGSTRDRGRARRWHSEPINRVPCCRETRNTGPEITEPITVTSWGVTVARRWIRRREGAHIAWAYRDAARQRLPASPVTSPVRSRCFCVFSARPMRSPCC